jgi:hypothetical protein
MEDFGRLLQYSLFVWHKYSWQVAVLRIFLVDGLTMQPTTL